MAITFKWSIQKLRVVPQLDDKTNVVVQADWLCLAIDGENRIQTASSGTQNVHLNGYFTPYEELTEKQVLSWCFDPQVVSETDEHGTVTTVTINLKTDIEARLTSQIQQQAAQVANEPPLPWA